MTAAVLVLPTPAHATPELPDLALPAPTGPFPVGVADLHLVDKHRADAWVPTERRELMVSLWYPAAGGGGTPDLYATPVESALILDQLEVEGVPSDALTAVRTYARVGVSARANRHGWPLVLLSPGFSFPRSSLTALAEDLASRGYVVAGVDHNYEAAAITFPDGRVTECLACTLLDEGVTVDVTRNRAADLSFTLTELTTHRLPAGVHVDSARVAVAGHSIGGSSAAEVMLSDRRFDAGINMDGTFFPPVTTPLNRPFLMLGTEQHSVTSEDDTWLTTWQHLTGWRRWVTVTGTEHGSFTDYAVLADQAGLPVQPLSGTRCAEITRAYAAAFLDRTLRHRPAPLMSAPSPAYPEVIWQPTAPPTSTNS
ncbi:hydrolase [Actinoplanes sp. NPDC026619]|uniref:alpha/beta hydrolase family protein n=1 Tax=Actinoplanes sp. NPDC026619 TaxID=3155798 RepID=UPI0033CB6D96